MRRVRIEPIPLLPNFSFPAIKRYPFTRLIGTNTHLVIPITVWESQDEIECLSKLQ